MAGYVISVNVKGTPITFTQELEAPDLGAALDAVKEPLLKLAETTVRTLGGVVPGLVPPAPLTQAAPE